MPKNLFILTFLTGLIFATVACKKDTTPPQPPTQYPATNIIFNENQVTKQTFNISADFASSITGNQGTVLTFRDSIFRDYFGDTISGTLTVEMTEIYKKSDMVWNRRPSYGDSMMLVTAGMLNIKVSFNNTVIYMPPDSFFKITMPSDTIDYQMTSFDGKLNDTTNIVNFSMDTPNLIDTMWYQNVIPRQYIVNYDADTSGWFAVAHVINNAPRTAVTVITPNNPSFTDALVFVVLEDARFPDNGVAQLYPAGSYQYKSPGLPVGYYAQVVGVMVSNGVLYEAFKPIQITQNQTVSLTFTETVKDSLVKHIKALDF